MQGWTLLKHLQLNINNRKHQNIIQDYGSGEIDSKIHKPLL